MTQTSLSSWPTETETREIKKNARKFNATNIDLDYRWHKVNFGENVQVNFLLRPFSCHFSINANNQFSKIENKELAYQIKQNIDNAMMFINYLEENFNNTKEM